jgi:hypothetical protein
MILVRSLLPQLIRPYPGQLIGSKWNDWAPWAGRSR